MILSYKPLFSKYSHSEIAKDKLPAQTGTALSSSNTWLQKEMGTSSDNTSGSSRQTLIQLSVKCCRCQLKTT